MAKSAGFEEVAAALDEVGLGVSWALASSAAIISGVKNVNKASLGF